MPEIPNQPGQIIVPHDDSAGSKASPELPQPESPANQPEPAVQAKPVPTTPAAQPAEPIPVDNDQSASFAPSLSNPAPAFAEPQGAHENDWQFQPAFNGHTPAHSPAYSWGALEFIAHAKSVMWYLLLAVATAVLAAVTFLLTKDKISTGIVVLAGLAFGIYAARKPNQIQYALDQTGLTIRDKHVAYNYFRSFSIADEGALVGISLFPLKRFGQLTTIYLDPKDEQTIVDILASHLPLEQHPRDYIDDFMRRIHF